MIDLRQFNPLRLTLFLAAVFAAMPAGAQIWFDTAAIMQPVVLNPCPGGQCPGAGADDEADGDAEQPDRSAPAVTAPPSDALTYVPSLQRRNTNLADLVAQTRRQNPESASAMERLFAGTDIFAQMAAALAPHGYAIDNLGDAYAFWWMTAWEGARGSNRASTPDEMQAVQAQAHRALATAPQVVQADNATRQQMAESLWIQAAMIDGMVDLAREQPELMPQLQRSVRQGARTVGIDLDAMRLTANGFVMQ
ncbi:DUF6683 family protein [Croceibacterium sp. TMG7-5b_MA50]|uniref:DUF6683 family protein n=1 Tax=Croceibacterium sp. TMG7-5b_MA50 TaxID=3121290 RepID=UPI003221C48C